MNNVDVRSNRQVCIMMGLKKEYEIAAKSQANTFYPAFIIDRTNEARVSGAQLYTDIFNRCKKVIYNQMISYIVNADDFDKYFTTIGTNLAVRNETKRSSREVTTESDTSEEKAANQSSTHSSDEDQSSTYSFDEDKSTRSYDSNQYRSRTRRLANRKIKREVRIALYRRRKRAELQRKTR